MNQVADHWLACKKLMIESTLAEKLKGLVGAEREIPISMINLMESHFTSQNEWDIAAAGKVSNPMSLFLKFLVLILKKKNLFCQKALPVADTVCKWITSVEKYFSKEQVCK